VEGGKSASGGFAERLAVSAAVQGFNEQRRRAERWKRQLTLTPLALLPPPSMFTSSFESPGASAVALLMLERVLRPAGM
jgi:hypothetical protein